MKVDTGYIAWFL